MDENKKSNRVVPPKGKKDYSTMLIDPALTGGYRNVRRKRSQLDDEFDAEDDMQARELRDLRMEEILTKRRARIAKLQRELKELEGSPEETKTGEEPKIPGISMNVARQIALLPDEERQRVVETYVLLQAAEAKHADALLPAMVGFAKANPGSSRNDMVEFAKAMTQQLETGVKIGQAGKETVDPYKPVEMMMEMVRETKKDAAADPWKPVEIMMDLVKETVKDPLKEMAERLQPQPSVFEQILLDDRLFTRAKELGMFGRHDTGTTRGDIDLEIEKLRGERELQVKKLELEWKKSMLEHESSERKTEALISTIAPMSAIFGGSIDQKMRQLGRQTGSHAPPRGWTPPPENAVMIQCSCGHRGTVSFPGPIPKSVNCPSCGLELFVSGAQGAGEPEEPGGEPRG